MKELRNIFTSCLIVVAVLTMLPVFVYAGDMMDKGAAMQDTKPEVAIDGFCPVCVLHGMPMKGSDDFVTKYNGKIYKFKDLETQKVFINDPEGHTKDLDVKFQMLMKK